MAVIYWIMMWPRVFGLGTAWTVGLILDVLQGELLGQHALALTIVGYLTLRFHLQIRIFPLWQLTMTVFALLTFDGFIQLLIEGLAGLPIAGPIRWTRILSGALLWPIVLGVMDRLRMQSEFRSSSF